MSPSWAKFLPFGWPRRHKKPGVVNDPDAVLQKTDALGRVLRLCVAWSNEADDCWKLSCTGGKLARDIFWEILSEIWVDHAPAIEVLAGYQVSKVSHGDISGVGMCGELGPLGPDICCGTHGVEFWV